MKTFADNYEPNLIFQSIYTMDQVSIHFERITYNIMDILSDIGGVYQVFLSMFGFIFYSISKQAYTLKLIEKLFFVKT